MAARTSYCFGICDISFWGVLFLFVISGLTTYAMSFPKLTLRKSNE